MFLGQFLTERPFSVVLAVAGVAGWIASLGIHAAYSALGEDNQMTGMLVMFYSMVAFFGIITLLDWLGRRKDRQSRNRAARS